MVCPIQFQFNSSGNNRHPPNAEVEKIVAKYLKTECRFGMDCQSSICLYKHTPPPEPEPEPAPALELEPDGSGAVSADAGCGNFDIIMTSLPSFQPGHTHTAVLGAMFPPPGRRVVRALCCVCAHPAALPVCAQRRSDLDGSAFACGPCRRAAASPTPRPPPAARQLPRSRDQPLSGQRRTRRFFRASSVCRAGMRVRARAL